MNSGWGTSRWRGEGSIYIGKVQRYKTSNAKDEKIPEGKKIGKEGEKGDDVRSTCIPNGEERDTAVSENADSADTGENEVNFAKRDVLISNANLPGR